jgi:hypothetical protein
MSDPTLAKLAMDAGAAAAATGKTPLSDGKRPLHEEEYHAYHDVNEDEVLR